MITKEDYIEAKNTKMYSIEMLYEFWTKNKMPGYQNIDIKEFSILLTRYHAMGGAISDKSLEEFFDKKFNIVKLYDKNGVFIKELN